MVDSCPATNKKAYVLIYLLETKLRAFIVNELEKKSKRESGGGWIKYIPRQIIAKCQERANADRGSYQILGSNQLIDYSSLRDLSLICNKNADVFEGDFGNLQVLTLKLKEIELIRHAIAHNRKLTTQELKRLQIFRADLEKCMRQSPSQN